MIFYLILAFTLIPFLELWLLLKAAATFGVGETLLICLVTGIVGGTLARREGAAVLLKLRDEVSRGGLPAQALLETALVFSGGLLLLTPGIATDILGFSMVIPLTRSFLAQAISARVAAALKSPHTTVHVVSSQFGHPSAQPGPQDLGPNLRRLDP